jgi:xanthine dehydrogenase YagR molybdenum-binding subunit
MAIAPARAIGAALDRVEGGEKVRGQALYAAEHHVEGAAHAALVQATISRGEVRSVDASAALAVPGVVAVIWHGNAPRLEKAPDELGVLQSSRVAYRGQIVAILVAEGLETAREAARLVAVDYAEEPHDSLLRPDHPRLYTPEKVNPNFPAVSEKGDAEAALAAAAVSVDRTYTTPAFHNNPLEPHATTAVWQGDGLVLYESTQAAAPTAETVAGAFGLDPSQVRVISPHVGGGFGSKGTPRPQVIVAAMAARVTGRPVKAVVTRQQMFTLTGYRTPTIQRVRLGADRDGRLTAIAHEASEQTSTLKEFAEQTTVVTRTMYAAGDRLTTHQVAALDVPTPSWMRAPGECPGMYALESAMDELAIELGMDPIELRVRNEPEADPESGLPFSSRHLVECLRTGAEMFGWAGRDPEPGPRRDGRWYVGTGVAASTYPTYRRPSKASARALADGTFLVRVSAADIGTGARTALTQIAADALDVPVERVRVEVGDSSFPPGPVAGGSAGTASWGTAVVKACRQLCARLDDHGGRAPDEGVEVTADTTEEIEAQEPFARHAYGAQFVEARVDADTGEVRVPRVLGVFAAGRIVNAKTARSQLLGGMTMGVSMALHEESVMDPRFGEYVNHDFAGYHVASCADIADMEAIWIEEEDEHINPMGSKGIGEIGIVGTAAAVANAVHHATGVRVRDLPIRLDRLLTG